MGLLVLCTRGEVDGIHSAKVCLLSVLSLMELISLASPPNKLLRDVTAVAAASRGHKVEVVWVRLLVMGEKGIKRKVATASTQQNP